MATQQDWRTEFYKGFDVHVTPLPHGKSKGAWDYSVRVTQPGEDPGAESELTAAAGDDMDYPTSEAAAAAGFIKGYAMVDELLK